MKQQAYIIIDIGTGNVRVAVCDNLGNLLGVARDNVNYITDDLYPESFYFDPEKLWQQIIALAKQALSLAKKKDTSALEINAITASSQREGIVLMDKRGQSLMGLPNHDHRGREWESEITRKQKDRVYELTGRKPSSLFSALKLIGIKKRRSAIYENCDCIMSISDWAQYQLCGVKGYENSQASETCLYDVQGMTWSDALCEIFDIKASVLPPLQQSGTVLGSISSSISKQLQIPESCLVIVGGADTQLAIKSTQPGVGDLIVVSGTTTPLAKITENYVLDSKKRTWTNRHVDDNRFILEANTGVTGLNYQRLKEIFYPNEGYDVIEKELDETNASRCVASLGSLIADEDRPLTRGGFVFNTPVSHDLTRAHFVRSSLWDIACCIKSNYDSLCDVDPYEKDYVWACGGGFQSKTLTQFVANLLNKKIRIREGYRQASVIGGVIICNEALRTQGNHELQFKEIAPQETRNFNDRYENWKKVRSGFKQVFL